MWSRIMIIKNDHVSGGVVKFKVQETKKYQILFSRQSSAKVRKHLHPLLSSKTQNTNQSIN